MAVENAEKFMHAVESDDELRAKVRGSLDHIHAIAKEQGYEFSQDDLRQHLRERWGMNAAPNYDSSADTCFFA